MLEAIIQSATIATKSDREAKMDRGTEAWNGDFKSGKVRARVSATYYREFTRRWDVIGNVAAVILQNAADWLPTPLSYNTVVALPKKSTMGCFGVDCVRFNPEDGNSNDMFYLAIDMEKPLI